jgi:hypothetical protein
VVEKGEVMRAAELNRFIADARRSGLVKAAIDRSGVAGLEVAR